jgi:two-component system chemotaxis response regulator CheY
MEKIYILCVEDQREVLDAVIQDLAVFEEKLKLEECESASEALTLMEEIIQEGDHVAVVISDHIMPGKTGVELLTEIKKDGRFPKTRKVLLTGLATHQDTIEAINQAAIDRYIEKPWTREHLENTVKILLTQYILENGIDYQDFTPVLDQMTLLNYFQQET